MRSTSLATQSACCSPAPWRHVDYLWRVFEGEEEPENVPEFGAAALAGKREEP